jgi:hypothetical protein
VLSLKRVVLTCAAALAACRGGGAGTCTSSQPSALVAQVCGDRCGSASRATGDFTGLGCAVRARLRVYAAGSGGTLGDLVAESCIEIPDAATFGSLFAVTSGVPGAAAVAMPRTLASDLGPGPYIAEVALVAPGAADGCAIEGPFVALGRSAPFSGSDTPATIDVPLGCHPTCLALATHSATVTAIDAMTLLPVPTPSSPTLGELFADQVVFPLDGQCAPPPMPTASAHFVALGPGVQSAAAGKLQLMGSFGEDPTAGCIAVHSGSLYACVAALTTAPKIFVPDAGLMSAIMGASPGGSAFGALLVLVVDGTGQGRQGVSIAGPNGVPGGGVASAAALTVPLPYTASNGLYFFAAAPPGDYVVAALPASGGTFSASPGPPGTVTTLAIVVP